MSKLEINPVIVPFKEEVDQNYIKFEVDNRFQAWELVNRIEKVINEYDRLVENERREELEIIKEALMNLDEEIGATKEKISPKLKQQIENINFVVNKIISHLRSPFEEGFFKEMQLFSLISKEKAETIVYTIKLKNEYC